MAKISVIVPVYNVEKFIRRCLDSIINQTMKDLEIILVDDGSTDNSGVICDEYAKLDNRITVIHKENGGVGSARNRGLDVATGEWIAFVDSDDYIEKNMYETLYKTAIYENVDVCACFFKYLTVDNKILFNPTQEQLDMNRKYNSKEFLKLIYKDEYINGICVSAWNKIYKKNIFDNLRFKTKIYEDDELVNQIYIQDVDIFVLNKGFYIYVQNLSSLTNKKFSEKNLVFIDILYDRLNLFKDKKMYKLYEDTVRLLCNITIEYYFKCNNKGKWQYKNIYKNVLKQAIKIKNISFKDKIRFSMFYISPHLYNCLVCKKSLSLEIRNEYKYNNASI